MDAATTIQIISTVGFPIFVAVWMLWRLDRTEKRSQEILLELKIALITLCERLSFNKEDGK